MSHSPLDLANPDRIPERTPAEVQVRDQARKPELDPTLGIAVDVKRGGTPKHRLVTLGDSLTQGFQSGAIFNTQLSWPRMVAWEMGWDSSFRYPSYWGQGGMPLNLELVIRTIERRFGPKLDNAWEKVLAVGEVLSLLQSIGSHWKQEWDHDIPSTRNHNLGVWGWDLRDTLSRTADTCAREVKDHPFDYFKTANARSAYRVLHSARDGGKALTPVGAAHALSLDGGDDVGNGIETLVVMLGANNALRSVVDLELTWSDDGYQDLQQKKRFTVWRPSHFKHEFELLVAELSRIRARHVIVATVPHVTVAPVCRGMSRNQGKIKPGSRYFEYYTRPWVEPADFDPRDERCITAGAARVVDSAIDQYNDTIAAVVREKRRAGQDWYLLELSGLLDRLASRRYIEDEQARPDWWQEVGGEYPMPAALAALEPKVTSYFFRSGPGGRTKGGLFSLDGVHPTTVGYGLIAQEVIQVMQRAGVVFRFGNGGERTGPIELDFSRLLKLDTLLAAPPESLGNTLELFGAIDQGVDGLFEKIGLHARFP
ncbi:MAG TPA: hypothetical protein VG937_17905 [Polyangiaceae bacterium]|nr:hypothetical protein [Polyangiaceae bacterium]